MITKKYNKSKTSKYNKSKKNKSRLKSNISILSYNVSWESLAGSVKKWSLCNNNTDKTNSKHYSVFVNNISSVFDNSSNKLDFVTLQEATDFQKLIKESSRLKIMKYEVHKSGLDTIVTFWDHQVLVQLTLKTLQLDLDLSFHFWGLVQQQVLQQVILKFFVKLCQGIQDLTQHFGELLILLTNYQEPQLMDL